MQSTTISKPAFELKGTPFSLPVLHLFDTDMDAVHAQLEKKVKQAPTFFHNAPIVINLQQLEDAGQIDFVGLVSLLRGCRFIPVGITGGTEQQKMTANAMELAVLTSVGIGTKSKQTVAEKHSAKGAAQQQNQREIEPDSHPKTNNSESGGKIAYPRLMTTPVRSGQRVIAPHGDLIVTAAVSSGAEILAAGNIHVYGMLRGRALAGIEGNENARIFCQHLEADLVSIAGIYQINDDYPQELRNNSVQVQIKGDSLLITTL